MKRPNFFIVGAPKCGTTSLADWLRQHPQVFFSDPKEPLHFCSDIHPPVCATADAYEQLFDAACEKHRAVGEGSTLYFLSRIAVPRIVDYQPEARFIVMLRPPVDMALSLHGDLLFQLNENIADFETAWRAQEERRWGKRIPKQSAAPVLLQYGEVCRLGEQLERLFRTAAREQVHLIFLEDMKRSPAVVWRRVTRFLEIETEPLPDFTPSNPRKALRSRNLKQLLRMSRQLIERLGIRLPMGILPGVHRLNRKPGKKQEISAALHTEMVAYFEEDVRKLSQLTGRDLSHWVHLNRTMDTVADVLP